MPLPQRLLSLLRLGALRADLLEGADDFGSVCLLGGGRGRQLGLVELEVLLLGGTAGQDYLQVEFIRQVLHSHATITD